MIVRLNVAVRNAFLNSMWNAGLTFAMFDGGTAEFRTGTQPAAADDASTGTVCEVVALGTDAMDLASNGTIVKNAVVWQDLASDADGLITWVRFKSADGTLVVDMDVTNTLGNGAVKVDDPNVLVGQLFIVTAFSVTMPASTP